ncbi:hypothetical protein B0F90DRAFT_1807306 [Multifurca ochricompacta]|uniref:GYF domain-containing protein n=1 Tax=Multifurca ochricompacta TaxID=376703 RepID=A0AAD4QU43_9AGAM|nr:hypothetical protein B0F90DRAFT_1807306 [Multifurca ochricompacta]
MLDSTHTGPSPISGSPAASIRDSASMHSLPAVQVTEPQDSQPLPQRSDIPSLSDDDSTPSVQRSLRPSATTPFLSPRRSFRSRSAIDSRSPNRLSGFFSHLIHRRDHIPPSPGATTHHERTTTTPDGSTVPSRESSPVPGPRPSTPPPSLPSPSLSELGLSLTVITDHLSPSHFSTPPASGAFLAPHYLLLCHAQGLDVLPLVSPPAPAPYALIRRVSFKSVVVMEHRGVLVAISGRRDGVRVYALDEIKRAVEWRLDVEIRREREKLRREEAKRAPLRDIVPGDVFSLEKIPISRPNLDKDTASPSPPRQLLRHGSTSSLRGAGGWSTSVNDVLRGTISRRTTDVVQLDNNRGADAKADWMDEFHSDDEAINVVAAGASGSQALDERTSSMVAAGSSTSNSSDLGLATSRSGRPHSATTLTPTEFRRAARPSDLDLSGIHVEPRPAMPPSPTPTLLTLRQALATFPAAGSVPATNSMNPRPTDLPIPNPDPDDDDENENGGSTPTNEPISFAQALLESRLPSLPPPGTRLSQQAILISQSHTVTSGDEDTPTSPNNHARQNNDTFGSRLRRRRWSVLDGIFAGPSGQSEMAPPTGPRLQASQDALTLEGRPAQQSYSPFRSTHTLISETSANPPPVPALPHSRFFSRIIGNPFTHRRSEDSADSLQLRVDNTDGNARKQQGFPPPHTPAPKLEYVKLPGTKGSLMIKAVETNRKSFLAILCGDNGEKVELFAGTYRTALGLSRTFILPDSPRSLELQLQGDDLVEVFLVFSQNVFGLEPATVRVREVRLGRAERRAARRRARELQVDDLLGHETDAVPMTEDSPNVNISVGFSVPSTESRGYDADQFGSLHYFPTLSFSPNFPLAAIVDEYVIPPTYPDFLHYRAVYEPEINGSTDVDLSQIQFSPPGLPAPPVAPPSRWFYRDPKGVVHGPWSSSRMHAWYREALLPPDLPVRREEDTDFAILKDLRQHCVDPSQPFGPVSIRTVAGESPLGNTCVGKPLLPPISLLSQPRLFGPPALFYSSRGGHSTTIVDGRGRSVLKDRFLWTPDELDIDGQPVSSGRLGDVKRLEAFDTQGRSVLVAMRQGGFEAVDLSDALLRPADASRDILPHFTAPPFQMNRRKFFTWRIGSPTSSTFSAPVTSLARSSSRYSTPAKKLSTGSGKSPARPEFGYGDADGEHTRNEIIFLGRHDNNVYLCERDGETFRVLRLSPFGTN